MTSGPRQQAESKGRRAETLAAFWLRLKGYRILARRHRTPAGEIDLVCRRGKLLVFVEVKARARRADGAEAVTLNQRRRIARAAEAYVQQNGDYGGLNWRFDLIVVGRGLGLWHLADAWRPDLP